MTALRTDPRLVSYKDTHPVLGAETFVADTARIIGDVRIGAGSSVWWGAVIRGDVFPIRIGARVNVQDMTMIHVTTDRHATNVGDDVTLGHRVTLHGCTIGARSLIGMGATVMDRVVIGEECIIGAGALVTPGTEIPPRSLAVGSPARVRRPLTEAEIAGLRHSASHYVTIARAYLDDGVGTCATNSTPEVP